MNYLYLYINYQCIYLIKSHVPHHLFIIINSFIQIEKDCIEPLKLILLTLRMSVLLILVITFIITSTKIAEHHHIITIIIIIIMTTSSLSLVPPNMNLSTIRQIPSLLIMRHFQKIMRHVRLLLCYKIGSMWILKPCASSCGQGR